MVSSFRSGQGMVLLTLMPPPGQVPGPSFLKGGDACLFFGMNHGCSLFLTLVCVSIQHAKSALHTKTEMLLQPGGPARVHCSHLHALPRFLEGRPHSVPCSLTALCSRELASMSRPTEAVPRMGADFCVATSSRHSFLTVPELSASVLLPHSVLGNLSHWLCGPFLFWLPHAFLFLFNF